jgi:hypothetical protein
MLDRLLLLGLSALAMSASEPLVASSDIFQVEQIDFEPDCSPNAAFRKIVDMMAGQDVDLAILQAVSGNIEHQLELDQPAEWNGLKLAGVHLYFGIERGPANYSLIFKDRPEDVRAVWNKRGWNLPAIGQARDIEGLEGYAAIGISQSTENEEAARVTCWRD